MTDDRTAFWRQRWMQAGGKVGFLLLPQFSMLELFCAVDPLRIASRLGGGGFGWILYSLDGAPVLASNGIEIAVDACFGDGEFPKILFIIASYEPLSCITPATQNLLRRMARHGVLLGAVDTGAFVLAAAQLLTGHTVTLHWEAMAAFAETYPDIDISPGLYAFDRDRLTCAGGSAVVDMMLFLIGLQRGDSLMRTVAEQVVHPPMRPGETAQRLPPARRYALRDRRIARAVALMEENMETPLSITTLAEQVGLSPRQFERLSAKHLGRSAKNFYVALRLERARQMLTDTGMGVAGVALATGFESPSHFSRLFRQTFGCPPSATRSTGVTTAPELLTENQLRLSIGKARPHPQNPREGGKAEMS